MQETAGAQHPRGSNASNRPIPTVFQRTFHVLIFTLFGCGQVPVETTTLPAMDCPDSGEVEASVETTSVGSLQRIRWQTENDVRARVVYDNGEGIRRETVWDEGGTDHEAGLLGVLPDLESNWSVEVDEGGPRCVATGVLRNGTLPTGGPEIAPDTIDEAEQAGGLTLVPVLYGTQTQAFDLVILDEQGRAVWSWRPPEGQIPPGFVTRASFAHDGQSIWFNSHANSVDSTGTLFQLGFDGQILSQRHIFGFHTDFVEMEDESMAVLTWEIRDFGDQRLLGDRIVVVQADGTSTDLWGSFDEIPVDLGTQWPTGFYPQDITVRDWSHVNGISWDAEADDLLVTMSVYDGVARIDGNSGETEWFLGDSESDLTHAPAGAVLTNTPHSVQALDDDKVLVFNRNQPACSFAAEILIDPDIDAATLLRTWSEPDCMTVSVLGEARRLSTGHTVVNYTSSGRIVEYAPSGAQSWGVSLEIGSMFGLSSHIETSDSAAD